ncbi:MAG: tetratricopeptide repeat protein [Rikenellaceae bacterium]|nr:tetratricopeptide repeat protein [Rikenellaceae bacterium]
MNRIRSSVIVGIAAGVLACGGGRRSFRSLFPPGYDSDSERVTYAYLEGLKAGRIFGDGDRAAAWFRLASEVDSVHAPSWFELSKLTQAKPTQAFVFSARALRLDSTNLAYRKQLGHLLLVLEDYEAARKLFTELTVREPQNPDNYRMLAMLYQQLNQPFAAIATLDGAEERLGRMEGLVDYKLRLLTATKQHGRAVAEAERTIELFPYNADSYLVLAEVYADRGKDSLARMNFERAFALDSTRLDIVVAMNDFYRNTGDVPKFIATTGRIFASREVSLDKKLDFLGELRSKHDFYRANFREVSDLAARLAIMYPDSYNALDVYAESLLGYGNIEEALKLYKGFVASLPDDSLPPIDAFNNIVAIESYSKRADSVVKYTSEALHWFPGRVELYLTKGASLAYMKEYGPAREAYEEAIRHSSGDSTCGVIMGMIGDLYHQQGDVDKAYASYRKALHNNENNPMVLNNYAYFLAEDGHDLPAALSMSSKAIKLKENYPTFIDTYAWVLYKMGNYAEAKRAMQQAIALDGSDSAELAFHYGEILYALKEKYMASVYWNKALERGYDKEVIDERLKLVE